jgi:UrcA family protein
MPLRLLPVLAAAIGLAGVTQVHAQPYDQPAYDDRPSPSDEVVVQPPYLPPGAQLKRQTVSFDDLDLSTRSGAYTLLTRIKGAARKVCSPDASGTRDMRDQSDYDGCLAAAVGRAVDDVGAPTLQDVYAYETPRYSRAYSYDRDD